MVSERITRKKMEFLGRILTRKGIIKMLLILNEGDKSFGELRRNKVTKNDKIVDLLGLVDRYQNDDGIVLFTLTKNGKELANIINELLNLIERILPEEG